MAGDKFHRNALKPQNMDYEERVNNMKNNKKGHNGLITNKIFPDGDLSLSNSIKLMEHGNTFEQRNGRPLSYASVDSFDREVFDFAKFCDENKVTPTRPAMALWLGVTSNTIARWKEDNTNPFSTSIKKAEELFHQFILEKTMQGSINTLLYFFLGKNWFGMQDKTEVVHKSSSNVIDLDEQERIINSTPGIVIDAEFKPVESEKPKVGVIDTSNVNNAQIEENEVSRGLADLQTSRGVDLEDFADLLAGEDLQTSSDHADLQTCRLADFDTHPHADLQTHTKIPPDTGWDDDL